MDKTNTNTESAMIEFIKKTTEAITVISESTKSMDHTVDVLKEVGIMRHADMLANFKVTHEKLDGIRLLFLYVIIPLISGILALVGVKFIFKTP